MVFNIAGNIIKKIWNKIPERFNNIELDEYQMNYPAASCEVSRVSFPRRRESRLLFSIQKRILSTGSPPPRG